jgi:predicted  nucleic acid-binding Zn-ribbon protein
VQPESINENLRRQLARLQPRRKRIRGKIYGCKKRTGKQRRKYGAERAGDREAEKEIRRREGRHDS